MTQQYNGRESYQPPYAVIMSDWGATEDTISVVTGLDMTMPGGISFSSRDSYFGENLVTYVNNGTIPEARVDDMAIRYAF